MAKEGTSYLFELRWSSPAHGGILGACHSLDIPLAFGTLPGPIGTAVIGDHPNSEAHALSRELQQSWIRFITTGAPGWAAYHPDQQLTRVLDTVPKTLPYPEMPSHRIWDGHPPPPFAVVQEGLPVRRA